MNMRRVACLIIFSLLCANWLSAAQSFAGDGGVTLGIQLVNYDYQNEQAIFNVRVFNVSDKQVNVGSYSLLLAVCRAQIGGMKFSSPTILVDPTPVDVNFITISGRGYRDLAVPLLTGVKVLPMGEAVAKQNNVPYIINGTVEIAIGNNTAKDNFRACGIVGSGLITLDDKP